MVKQRGTSAGAFRRRRQGSVDHSDPETLYEESISRTPNRESVSGIAGQAGGSVNFELVHGRDQEAPGTYTPSAPRLALPFLKTLGWGAIVQAEEAACSSRPADREGQRLHRGSPAVLSVLLAVIFAAGSQPIGKLAESARRLASGDFSQNIDVTAKRDREFAETFLHDLGDPTLHRATEESGGGE
jgi:methyl-accepting chemotaxis protein